MIEVVTLKNSMLSKSTDLGHIRYTPDALELISTTAIELDDTGNQIMLNYQSGRREKILESFNKTWNLADSQAGNADVKVENSEISNDDLGTGVEEQAQEPQSRQDTLDAEVVDKHQTHTMVNTDGLHEASGRSHVNSAVDVDPKPPKPYAVTSLNFLTLPLESGELRFSVSFLATGWFVCAYATSNRLSKGCLS